MTQHTRNRSRKRIGEHQEPQNRDITARILVALEDSDRPLTAYEVWSVLGGRDSDVGTVPDALNGLVERTLVTVTTSRGIRSGILLHHYGLFSTREP